MAWRKNDPNLTNNPLYLEPRVSQTEAELADVQNKLTPFVEVVNERLADTVSKKELYSDDYTPPIKLDLKDFSGYNQPFHPSVLYIEEGFAGYSYWMVQSPLPIGGKPYRDRWEVPIVYKSHDGINWIPVANPLDDLTQEEINNRDYMSDPHLVYREDTKTLEVWYRLSRNISGLPTNILRKTTVDGVNWTEREELVPPKANDSIDFMRSPSIIWDNVNKEYRAWYQNNHGLYYNTSIDGKTWGEQQQLVLDVQHNCWHLDVNYFDGYYHLLSYSSSSENIAYYKSTDGINFEFVKILLSRIDGNSLYSNGLYRACSIKDAEGNVRVYSSAITSMNRTAIIMFVANSIEEIKPIPTLKNSEKLGRVLVKPVDSHTPSSHYSEFEKGFITQNIVTTANAQGSPNGVGGLLVTDYTAPSSFDGDIFVYQTYYERSRGNVMGRVYIRNILTIPGYPWSDWVLITGNHMWFGKVNTFSSTFTKIDNLKITNYINIDLIQSEGGTTPELSKTLWAKNEISTDPENPTTIGTTGTQDLLMYMDSNNVYIKYSAPGNNYPLVIKFSYF